jgi:ABC-type uncharacterized transport system substrate-binding protein
MSGVGSRIIVVLFAVAATLSTMAVACAHPHVLPTVRTDLIFSPAGHVTTIQYTWLYDSAYSTFVGRDLDADKDGTISAGELAAFAKNQIDALAEHSYFTTVTTPAGGFAFGPPESYAVEKLGDGRLQLSFTIPLKTAAAVDKQLTVELYDPDFFAYFTTPEDGVRLVGAPQGCVPIVTGPQPIDLRNTRIIPAVFWDALNGSKTAGQQFVNRIAVTCP